MEFPASRNPREAGPPTGLPKPELQGTGDRKEKPIARVEAHPDLLNPAPMVKHYEIVSSTLASGKQGT